MLSYLKQMKITTKNLQSRYISIILCLMQCTAPILTIVAFIVLSTQEPSMAMIIKAFTTIIMDIQIDDMFVVNFPQSFFDNADQMNQKKALVFSKDNNTPRMVVKRYWKAILRVTGVTKKAHTIPLQYTPDFNRLDEESRKIALQIEA